MNSFGKFALGVAMLGVLVFSLCPLASAQALPPGAGGGGGLPPLAPDGSEIYQHAPLPKDLPKGVTVQDAQRGQAIIDSYKRIDPLTVTKIKGNIYFAKGGARQNAGNMAFVIGKTSVIVVDSKGVPDEKDALAELAKITPKPVKTVILLHAFGQAGVAALPAGVTVISQENAKKTLEVLASTGGYPKEYLPTKTVDKDETMTIDGVRVRLLHWAPAYTDGDMVAYFPDEKVAYASNLIVNDFPLASTVIDHPMHGSVAGWLESVKALLALNADVYISGHGPLYTKRDVKTKFAFIQDKWDRIKAMVAQGKSLDEIKAAIGGPPERNPSTTDNIYAELTAK